MSDDAASWQTTSVRRGCGNHRIEASRLDPLAVGAHDGAVCREVDGEQPHAVKRRTRPRRGPGGAERRGRLLVDPARLERSGVSPSR
jgi:hypothetical protein